MTEEHGKDHIAEGLAVLKNVEYKIKDVEKFINRIYGELDPQFEVVIRHTTFEDHGLDHCLVGLVILKGIDYPVEDILTYIQTIYPDLLPYNPFGG